MKRIFLISIVAAVGLSVFLGGCEKEAAPEGEPIVIGSILRLSLGASDGIPAKRGIEIAVRHINADGGINGRPLEVIFEDSQDKDTEAVNAANKLISVDKVPVIIGPMKSGETLAVAPIAEDNKIILITPTATSPKVTDAGAYIYRGCSRIDTQVDALVNYAIEKYGAKKAAILFSKEPYGEGFKDLFVKYFGEKGVEVVAVESFMVGDKDFKAQLTKIAGTQFDILCIPGYLQETAPAVVQARMLGITAPTFGGYGDIAPLYIELAGPAGEGHVVSGEYDEGYDTPRNKEFVKEYYDIVNADPNEPNNIMFAAITYDMTHIVADAMMEVGTDPTAIKVYLDNLKDYDGVTGKLSFDSSGDVQKGGIYLFEVKDGKYVNVK
jgi:branched-chain amino acid transport system substrate-binding protein